jgi:hypothetical protein
MVLGRTIVITEDPRLHLVWYYDRVFIKPLPKYLLSHNFWKVYLLDHESVLGPRQQRIREAALGFIRTYRYLIKHESDFLIAQDDALHLIPKGVRHEEFCNLSLHLKNICDSRVSDRYTYGELSLTRLNFWAKVILHKLHFHCVQRQYGEYFAHYFGPILFIFAIVSIILSAMQVEIAVDQVSPIQYEAMWQLCRWFSILCLVCVATLIVLMVPILFSAFLNEFKIFAFLDHVSKSRRRESVGE